MGDNGELVVQVKTAEEVRDWIRVDELIKKAQKTKNSEDKAAAKEAAIDFLKRHPEVAKDCANLEGVIETTLLESFMDEYSRMAVKAGLQEMRKSLEYGQAPLIEKLLIDRLVVSWLRVIQAEIRKNVSEAKSISLPWAVVWDKRLEIANKSFLRAVRSLAFIRRQPMPKILAQVNINNPRPETTDPLRDRVG